MRDDDPLDKPQAQQIVLKNLSIRELHSRISDLRAEIAEIEALISAKEASKSAADLFFKPPTS
ncbi:MAG: hypothetical protein RL186_1594 [Pseudomonadota bacterium]|jgi:uncharacterized small protein (DUF1192 family)